MYDFQFQCKKKGIDVIIGESADIKGRKTFVDSDLLRLNC